MSVRANGRTDVGRRSLAIRRAIGDEIRRLRLDSGVSQVRLAYAAGIDQGHLSRIEGGAVEASVAVLVAIAEVLGADLSIRLFPTTGPRIHDRIQAAMAEAVLKAANERWKGLVEVAVRRPARGAIDLVLADRTAGEIVAAELQSDLRRLEQQIRWAADKAASLPSSDSWPILSASMDREPRIRRLLVLRSTVRTRELARQYATVLGAAYPARASEAFAALCGDRPWPDHALLWCRVEGGRAVILPQPPRGVMLGR
jgi:transcriptional regulator with XRE-family HTH domain